MIINNNIPALNTHRMLAANNLAAQKAMEKLSSGLRINRAGDDAAGLAISEKMRAQIRGLNQAVRNAQDGISLIQTAEGALQETHAILQRMRELAVQAANDTNTNVDRDELQKEVDQLAEEITRIANNTEFNTKNLLAGEFTARFHIGANKNQSISLNISDMSAKALNVLDVYVAATEQNFTVNNQNVGEQKVLKDADNNIVAVFVNDGYYRVEDLVVVEGQDGLGNTTYSLGVVEGATAFYATESALTDDVEVELGGINISSQEAANAAISVIDKAIELVSAERSKLGAVQNRLEHTINNLGTSAENLQAAESRIRDVDMAREIMEFTRANILSQASQAMLAQANQLPQSVLQLLG
ncbi:flagellin domain protein [Caldalkalibacillus thermarum TA2.A1]|uniref:Flagellin n=1 Tax=Caldalkalibacillus thermarum (strain TA2.A1) TaxID=986075 RepID=F5L438_CALTT|nr:flagellin [Caldalkalibacillus thermarum]EGL83889.1 flagellin domain protein [Caldalkalibacillus thermarum TA2.A1]QZT34632.1 flagellin [Caldalkalibacillus thermarum TA2.A1]